MNEPNEPRKQGVKAHIDWSAITEDDLKEGREALAVRLGVTAASVTNGLRRLKERGNQPTPVGGRPKMPIPRAFSPELPTKEAMKMFRVSLPTVRRWRREWKGKVTPA